MIVAVIDDGTRFYKDYDIIQRIEITSDLKIKSLSRLKFQRAIHGTICVEIVKKYYHKAEIISIKILNEKSGMCTKQQLIRAIEWCIDNKVRIVNISLGTTNYNDFESIENIVNKAYNSGLIIIASYSNKNDFTVPASFPNVIGVKSCSGGYLNEGEYIFNLQPIDGIEITACSTHKIISKVRKITVTNECNSFASPMITAKVCQIMEYNPNISFEMVKMALYENSINSSNY